jgi:hypothetical protein
MHTSLQARGLKAHFGFSGHQTDRRCRELAQEGKIERTINGKYVEYRSKPRVQKTYVPAGKNIVREVLVSSRQGRIF